MLELIEDELFDTLVTDLDLPGGTGLDLVLTAIKLRPQMRSVLMTGYSCSAIRKRASCRSLDTWKSRSTPTSSWPRWKKTRPSRLTFDFEL